jgi:hypothetical protein
MQGPGFKPRPPPKKKVTTNDLCICSKYYAYIAK